MKSKKLKGLAGLLGVGAVSLSLAGGTEGDTMGYLKVENNLNSHTRHVIIYKDDTNFPGATDGYDNGEDNDYDIPASSNPSGYPNCYSDISTHNLWDDFRAENSTSLYEIDLSFNGELTENKENWLEFSYPGGENYCFGDAPIYLQKKEGENLTGPIYDVRDIIDNYNGKLDLEDVQAGNYDQWNPYSSFVLDIGGNHIPEPNSLSLLAMAGIAGVGVAGLGRGKRKGILEENLRK